MSSQININSNQFNEYQQDYTSDPFSQPPAYNPMNQNNSYSQNNILYGNQNQGNIIYRSWNQTKLKLRFK